MTYWLLIRAEVDDGGFLVADVLYSDTAHAVNCGCVIDFFFLSFMSNSCTELLINIFLSTTKLKD